MPQSESERGHGRSPCGGKRRRAARTSPSSVLGIVGANVAWRQEDPSMVVTFDLTWGMTGEYTFWICE